MDDTRSIESDSDQGNNQNVNPSNEPAFTLTSTTPNNSMASFHVDVGRVVAGGSDVNDNLIRNEQLYVRSRIDSTISMAILGGLLFIACVATIDSHLENNDPSEITEAVLFTFCIITGSATALLTIIIILLQLIAGRSDTQTAIYFINITHRIRVACFIAIVIILGCLGVGGILYFIAAYGSAKGTTYYLLFVIVATYIVVLYWVLRMSATYLKYSGNRKKYNNGGLVSKLAYPKRD